MRLLTFILTINSIVCFGQNIFIDNVRNFPWTCDDQFDIEQIQKTKEIGLSILRTSKDSLKTNRTIWTFKDDLTLRHWNPNDKGEDLILRCKYDFDWDKGLLNIQWPDKQLTYTFTFVSTGNFLLLRRQKAKKQKE